MFSPVLFWKSSKKLQHTVPMEDIIYGPINILGHGPFSLSPDDIKNIEEKYKQMKTDRKKEVTNT